MGLARPLETTGTGNPRGAAGPAFRAARPDRHSARRGRTGIPRGAAGPAFRAARPEGNLGCSHSGHAALT
jgi:hypothetical protein